MSFTSFLNDTRRLAIGFAYGRLTEAEIVAGLDFLWDVERMPPTADRLVLFDPFTDLRELDADALRRVQEHMMDRSPPAATFRVVLVAPSIFHQPIAELYKAMWDSHLLPGVEFSVVESMADAVQRLTRELDNPTPRGREQ